MNIGRVMVCISGVNIVDLSCLEPFEQARLSAIVYFDGSIPESGDLDELTWKCYHQISCLTFRLRESFVFSCQPQIYKLEKYL